MKIILYTRPADSGLSIVNLAPQNQQPTETEEQFIERVRQQVVPADALNVQIVDATVRPTDRTNRNTWKWQ